MDSPEIDQLEQTISEIEFLFQEGVVFTQEHVDRIRAAAELLNNLSNDPFLIVRHDMKDLFNCLSA